MQSESIAALVEAQRDYFNAGNSRSYEARVECLQRLRSALISHEREIHQALRADLGKPEFESYLAETGFCLHEISFTLKHLKRWMKPVRRLTSIFCQPGSSRIEYSPLGVNLIIAPFNYPVMLALSPLIAAISAGNTVVIKTSELTPASSEVIRQLIESTFDPRHIAYVPGAVEETTDLLAQPFDHIFFTGSARVGRIVMTAAARHLTPVTLELGGKSPCIVHDDADLDIAARRIVFGKFLNAGQTCIAPDYVLVHQHARDTLLEKLKARIEVCFGRDPSTSPDYGRIVSDSHFQRLAAMIDPARVVTGGETDAVSRYIAPTVLKDVSLDDAVMAEEIFGPLLPVLEYTRLDEVYATVRKLPQHPLALYLFTRDRAMQKELMSNIQFGGGCVNQCVVHISNHHLPFGGVGQSGIGDYHGLEGFERFSHRKSILQSATWFDVPLAYPPYRDKIRYLRRLLK